MESTLCTAPQWAVSRAGTGFAGRNHLLSHCIWPTMARAPAFGRRGLGTLRSKAYSIDSRNEKISGGRDDSGVAGGA
jgi:hypothetical protein